MRWLSSCSMLLSAGSLLSHSVPQVILRGFLFLRWNPKAPTCIAIITGYHSLTPSVCVFFTEYKHKGLPSGLLQNLYVNAKIELLCFYFSLTHLRSDFGI